MKIFKYCALLKTSNLIEKIPPIWLQKKFYYKKGVTRVASHLFFIPFNYAHFPYEKHLPTKS